jgi:hypothetical protein
LVKINADFTFFSRDLLQELSSESDGSIDFGFIVSWNLKHIVNFRKIPLFNAVNVLKVYRQIEPYTRFLRNRQNQFVPLIQHPKSRIASPDTPFTAA